MDPMRSLADLFQAVDRLAAAPNLSPAAVETHTRVAMAVVDAGNPFFEVYRGTGVGGLLTAVELRVPGEGAAPMAGPLLILTPAPGVMSDLAELTGRFGPIVDVRPAPPTAGPGLVPASYAFAIGDTRVTVGLSDAGRIQGITLERRWR